MGFLDFLSPALTVATGAAGAYEQGKTERAATEQKNTLTMLAQLRQAQQDAEKRTMDAANIQHLGAQTRLYGAQADQVGEPKPASPITLAPGAKLLTPRKGGGYDETANNPKDENETWKLSNDWLFNGQPIRESNRGNYQTVEGQPVDAGKLTRYTAPHAPVIIQGTDAQGKPIAYRVPTVAGAAEQIQGFSGKIPTGGAGSAPLASKEGQFGEMLKKAPDIFKAAEQLDVGVGMSSARDISEHGIGVGSFRIPGTQGVGNLMLNQHPAYASYQAALAPFVLANAHAVSGARINKDQSDMIRKSLERQPGDFANPTLLKQRDKNMIDQMNSIAASLPAEAVRRQEEQMSPAELADLVARGYKSVGPSAPSAGRGGGAGGGAMGGAKKPITAAGAKALRAAGRSDAYIDANYKVQP